MKAFIEQGQYPIKNISEDDYVKIRDKLCQYQSFQDAKNIKHFCIAWLSVCYLAVLFLSKNSCAHKIQNFILKKFFIHLFNVVIRPWLKAKIFR